MEFFPWWLGALAFVAAVFAYYIILRRPLGVSGALGTALSSTARRGERELNSMGDGEVERALMAATLAQFPELANAQAPVEPVPPTERVTLVSLGWSKSALFMGGILLGGAAFAAVAAPGFQLAPAGLYAELFGPLSFPALFIGGIMVGAGTAIAGGCTTGHGLVGCGRLQVPSLIATACFFGTAIVLALLAQRLLLGGAP